MGVLLFASTEESTYTGESCECLDECVRSKCGRLSVGGSIQLYQAQRILLKRRTEGSW